MVQMLVKYEGALRCKVIHEPTGTFFPTDAPLDNNGKGEVASPTDLCALRSAQQGRQGPEALWRLWAPTP